MTTQYINPGQKLWLVINDNYGSFIVPVIAKGVDDIYVHPYNSELSVWHYRYVDKSELLVPMDKKDEFGRTSYKEEDPSWLGNAKLINQFIWIDEPVGHAIQIGYDGLCLTLQEAQENSIPSRKKHLARRLKKYRKDMFNFIIASWNNNGKSFHNPEKLPNKKLYVVRK